MRTFSTLHTSVPFGQQMRILIPFPSWQVHLNWQIRTFMTGLRLSWYKLSNAKVGSLVVCSNHTADACTAHCRGAVHACSVQYMHHLNVTSSSGRSAVLVLARPVATCFRAHYLELQASVRSRSAGHVLPVLLW